MSEHTLIVEYDAKHVFFEFWADKAAGSRRHKCAHAQEARAPGRPPLVLEPEPPDDKQDADAE